MAAALRRAASASALAARDADSDPQLASLLDALPEAAAPFFIGSSTPAAMAAYRLRYPGAACHACDLDGLAAAADSDLLVLTCGSNTVDVSAQTLEALRAVSPSTTPLFVSVPARSAPLDALCTVLMDAGWMPTVVTGTAGAPGTVLQAIRRFEAAAPGNGSGSLFAVVVPTTTGQRCAPAAIGSPGLAEVGAVITTVADAGSAAQACATALEAVTAPWVLLCREDAYFPATFGTRLNALLAAIPANERDGSLIGFIGIGVDAQKQGFAPAGFVVEGHHREDFPASSAAVSIDELAVVLSRDSLHRIDPAMGWHLWATDLCLTAICQHQLFPRIVTLPLMHRSSPAQALPLPFYASAELLTRKFAAFGPIPTLNGTIDAGFLARRPAPPRPPCLPEPERLENDNFMILDHLDAAVGQCLEAGSQQDALARIVNGVNDNFIKPAFRNRGLYIPQFDRRLEQLAGMLDASDTARSDAPADGGTLLIATELYDLGGHSRALLDVSLEVDRPVLILTDLFNMYAKDPAKARAVVARFAHADVIILPPASYWDKCGMMQRAVAALRPGAIMYFSHHQDPVPFVGTLGAPNPKKLFFHHADHNPSLGCTLPGMTHVDFSDTLRQVCERQLAQACPVLPMYVPDLGRKDFRRHIPLADFSVVTSGRAAKYRREGPHSLQEMARVTLDTVGGKFFHIGPLDDAWLASLRQHLAGAGLDPARFVHLGQVPSVWNTLKDIDAACYLGSAPEGGGRAAIEAQGCGYPLVYFRGHAEGSLMANYSLYADEASGWRNTSELRACLLAVVAKQRELGERARRHYEATCSRPVFQRAIDQLLAG